jgi:hypothetical protein
VRAAFVLLLLAGGALAAPPLLGLPIQCNPGIDCHIQNFFDHDVGAGWRDHACGGLSYDNHTGTDFRVADLAAMEAGVDVVAAAAGIVKGVRDGEPDISVRQRGRAELRGKDAGNGVPASTTATAGKPSTAICGAAASRSASGRR